MLLFDHIENAYRSLRRNRTRSILTVLGITIGIASVTSILALSGGVTRVIDRQVEALDGNLAVIRPGLPLENSNALTSPVSQQGFSTSTLSEADIESLQTIPGVAAVAPIMTVEGTLQAKSTTVKNNVVVATTPAFTKVNQLPVRDGQFIDSSTDRDTAVVGSQLAINLFGTDKPLGQTFELRGQRFTVIGILKRTTEPVNYNNIDFNHAAIVSFETGKSFHQGRSQIQQINIQAETVEQLPTVTKAVHEQLLKNHLGEEDFSVIHGQDIGLPTNQLFRSLTEVLTAIAAISLFVGGIGIMNIMLVGVAERTREIGIRKAVGASNGMIIMQFLIESLMMSLLGGILGYVLGYAVAFVISTFLFFTPALTWVPAVAALVMALGTGVIFGLYPAIRAARKDTIESLRQYS